MNQQELKEAACNYAYQLIKTLDRIQDVDFVDDILCAVSGNDEIALIEMMYET